MAPLKRPEKSGALAHVAQYLEMMKEKKAAKAELKLVQLCLDCERFDREEQQRDPRMERDAATLVLMKY